jgi:hypothetical protein
MYNPAKAVRNPGKLRRIGKVVPFYTALSTGASTGYAQPKALNHGDCLHLPPHFESLIIINQERI